MRIMLGEARDRTAREFNTLLAEASFRLGAGSWHRRRSAFRPHHVGGVGGRERTASELETLLGTAGLRLARIIPMPLSDKLIEAVPA